MASRQHDGPKQIKQPVVVRTPPAFFCCSVCSFLPRTGGWSLGDSRRTWSRKTLLYAPAGDIHTRVAKQLRARSSIRYLRSAGR